MTKLTKQKAYLPVEEDYGIYLAEFSGYPDGYSNIGNLKEVEAFVLTSEQLNQLIREAFEAGQDSKEDEINGDGETSFEEFINDKIKIT